MKLFTLSHIDVGATLFIPATHKSLVDIVCYNKYPELKSVLIDTEDGIDEKDLDTAIHAIESLLDFYDKKKLHLFLRPRNIQILKMFFQLKNIQKVDGFILPKFTLHNASEYLHLLHDTNFLFMPSIEGEELFNQQSLHNLKNLLLPFKKQIPLLRYGLEDMLRQLSMKRSCEESIFDYAATASVLGQFIAIFKSSGFFVSGGVYPCFNDEEGFIKDVKRDLKEGLFGKTLIHPRQIKIANELYRVTQVEYNEALEILESEKAVFNQNSKMAETQTMSPFAREILQRKEVYGLVK